MEKAPVTIPKSNEIHSRVAQLETDVIHLSKAIEGLGHKIDDLVNAFSKSAQTNWTTLGTWAGVLLVLVAMWTAPMMTNISKLETAVTKQGEVDTLSTMDRGQIDTRLNSLENQADLVTGNLEKEMQLLDEVIQREMKQLFDNKQVLITELTKQVDANKTNMKELVDRVTAVEISDSTLDQQLQSLKSIVDLHTALDGHAKTVARAEELCCEIKAIQSNRFTGSDGGELRATIESLKTDISNLRERQSQIFTKLIEGSNSVSIQSP